MKSGRKFTLHFMFPWRRCLAKEMCIRDRIQILAELTRLRQICCDPAMIYENYRGGSAKTEVCMELLKTAASLNFPEGRGNRPESDGCVCDNSF